MRYNNCSCDDDDDDVTELDICISCGCSVFEEVRVKTLFIFILNKIFFLKFECTNEKYKPIRFEIRIHSKFAA